MENPYNRIRRFNVVGKLPLRKEINSVLLSFSSKEKMVFFGLVIALILSTISILSSLNRAFMVQEPLPGGSLSIGIVGIPRFVNPIIATSDADKDIASLIYSGLMRKNDNGDLIPDLAEKYERSEDGLTYTFTLKNNLQFHDGKPLTAEDVAFTVNKIKDPVITSPNKVNWDGVTVEAIDKKTVRFTLRQPYASFLEHTTLGIMPRYIWEDGSPLELNAANTNPIGSGPYMIEKTRKESSGIIDYYELIPFKKFALGKPYIENIRLYFYPNENEMVSALEKGIIDQAGSITPANAEHLKEKNYRVESFPLPRIFGLFFNQNVNQLFVDKAVVSAINEAIDKERIVNDVLLGYGVTIDSPIPPSMTEYQQLSSSSGVSRTETLEKVRGQLEKEGWVQGADGFLEKTKTENGKKSTVKLQFSISTGSVPELVETAELIKANLAEVGIKVDVKTFEIGSLNQNVIRPRNYEALLFGQIINQEADLFAFWHSSQRRDPGLNIATYTNIKVDKILEDAFVTSNEETRIKKYLEFENEIKKDMPAVFLYSPNFIYTLSKNLKQKGENPAVSPQNRYSNAYLWYTETDDVWKIFAR